jgi:flagellar hook-associated protein 1 FlgK
VFQGLSTALTSLYASQKALETTGNNIANANTQGYSRQTVLLEPNGTGTGGSYWSGRSKVGTGVNVADVIRLRDAFLDSRSLSEHGSQGELNKLKDAFNTLELSFKEPSETGLNKQIANFFASWDDVTDATDVSSRSSVIEQARTLVTGLQQTANDLEELAKTAKQSLRNDVKQLNAWAQNVADLNVAIQAANSGGTSPNALLDQRDALVSKMADYAGVSTQPTQNGSISVQVGGVSIVRDAEVRALQVDDSGSPLVLRWDGDKDPNTSADGVEALVLSGSIKGSFDTVAGILPRYRTLIDSVATNLISTVNTQHQAGIDVNGTAGVAFFTGTSAANISVNSVVAGDTTRLAVRQVGGGAKDAENARAMAKLAELQTGPLVEYRNLINTLGVEASRASNRASIQDDIVNNVDGARDSISGVNLDEEMTNMIRFQKSYTATAKYLNVMNEMLDSLIALAG